MASMFYPQPEWHLPMAVAAVGPNGRPFFVNRVASDGRSLNDYHVNVRGGEYARRVTVEGQGLEDGKPAGDLEVEVIETDGISSFGMALCLKDDKGGTCSQRTVVFGPSLAFRSKPVSELTSREPMPRVHAVALNHKANAVAMGCSDARSFVCRLPFPENMEDGSSADGESGASAGAGAGQPLASPPASPSSTQLAGHLSDVTSVFFMPSDKVVVTGCSDMRVRIIDVASGRVAATLVHGGGICGVAATMQSKGRNLVSCGRDSTLKLWQLPGTECLASIGLPATPNALALMGPPSLPSPIDPGSLGFKGFAAAVADDDGFASIVDLSSQTIVARLPVSASVPASGSAAILSSLATSSYESGPKAFAVSYDARSGHLAVGGSDGMVAVYDVSTLYDGAKGEWQPSTDASECKLLWHGALLRTGAEVQCLQLVDVHSLRARVHVEKQRASGGASQPLPAVNNDVLVVLAGFSEGTCGFFRLEAGGAVSCPVSLSGPNSEPVRSLCTRLYPASLSSSASEASAEAEISALGEGDGSYLTVVTACNDGFARTYELPVETMLGALSREATRDTGVAVTDKKE